MTKPILRTNGSPFATRANAKGAATRLGIENYEIVQHGNGWAIIEQRGDSAPVALKPGDYVLTKGMTEDDYHAVAKAFMAAGAESGEYPNWSWAEGGYLEHFGWVYQDGLYHCDGLNIGTLTRQLTLTQVLNATNARSGSVEQDNAGWIENTGVCPASAGARIDVRYRDGKENIGVRALISSANGDPDGSLAGRTATSWGLFSGDTSITHYRLSQDCETTAETPQQEKPMTQQHLTDQLEAALAALADAQKTVDRLREKYRAAYPHIHGEQQPTEDMTDPSNWRAGDVIECISDRPDLTLGKRYIVKGMDCDNDPKIDDDEDCDVVRQSGYFRFILRP